MHKRIINPVSALVFLTLLAVGAAIPATYAWYSVSTSISVQSSSVLVTTASPDYGEFTLEHLYILQPDYGEVNLNTPSNAVKDVELFPVSTVNGINYFTKFGNNVYEYNEGKYTFLAQARFGGMQARGMRLNFNFNVGIPKCGNVEHPEWTRVHLQMADGFNFETKELSGKGIGNEFGYILVRNTDSEHYVGINPSKKPSDFYSEKTEMDQGFSVDVTDRVTKDTGEGNVYFKVTLYLEGMMMATDERMTNEISISMFVYPSPKK